MAVGGQALHWGGTCNRFSEEDLSLKSMDGLYVDWPLEWAELEKSYCEAERRLGVSGEPSPFPGDKRSEPYPMKPIPLTWSLDRLKEWGDKSGIAFQATPQAKNTVPYDGRAACIRCGTCDICPTGARYSPDFTFKRRLAEKKITLHDRTLIRKLVLDDSKTTGSGAWRSTREPTRDSGISRQSFRRRLGLYVELTPPAEFGQLPIPKRPREPGRASGKVHERSLVHSVVYRIGR
jgi:choline dehydrogenase-like flavoprotein